MAEETISIIRIETGQAVKSVNDLKENIKTLKDDLGKLDIGSKEYQNTLHDLQVNQKALKDAMYATNTTMEEVAANAKGINVVFDENNKLINKENQSYNALVNTMAELKTRWRATSDEAERANLGEQIKQINDELKGMDASVGNFSRSVGDYTNSVKKALGDFPFFADPAKKAIKAVNDSASLLAGNPVMGVIALITPLVVELTKNLKEDETSMSAINKVMNAMKPVMDFFQGVLTKVVDFTAQIISQVGDFLGSSGIFNKLVNGVAGVGNAILSFIVAPFKGVIAAIQVFKEEGVKGLGNAAKAFANEMKSGVAFKSNFDAGVAAVDGIAKGARQRGKEEEKKAKNEAKEKGKSLAEEWMKAFNKALAEGDRKLDERRKARLEEQAELDRLTAESFAEVESEIEEYYERERKLREADAKDAEEKAKAKIASMYAVVDATSSILDTLAELYEADEKNSEKNANRIKALRIASATIDTISGAIKAYMACAELPPPFGQIAGAANAAAVTAAGMANIAKIRSTNMSGSVASPSAPSVNAAPPVTMQLPNVRNVTSASEEDRLNQMASDQRVVLVMSDLEVKQNQSRVQVAEASF